MANNIRDKKGVLGAAVALVIASLMIAYPVVASSTPLASTNSGRSSLIPPTPFPTPPPTGEQIILTSTSGQFFNLSSDRAITFFGPAAGTMTLTVTNRPVTVATSLAMVYTLSVTAGSVTLGSTTLALTGGSAFMNPLQSIILGSGTVEGGTFIFRALSLAPSVRSIHPLNFSLLLIHIHVGGHYYFVLLHVKTTVVPPSA